MLEWIPLTISEIQSCEDLSKLKAIMIKIQKKLEYDFILYSIHISSSFKESSINYIGNFPSKWIQRYEEQDYSSIDPTVKHCISSNTPICWYDFYSHKDTLVTNFFNEASQFGLLGGVSIGFRINSGEVGILSLSKKEILREEDSSYCLAVMYMSSLQPYIHNALKIILSKENEKDLYLTKRELECLSWIAEGKTSCEISSILKISENTVIFHIKNIIEKLEVSNRTQAISKAILLGLIYPDSNENHRKYISFKE